MDFVRIEFASGVIRVMPLALYCEYPEAALIGSRVSFVDRVAAIRFQKEGR